MSFSVKDWKNGEEGGTPLSAAALEDIEERLSDYTDNEVAAEKSARESDVGGAESAASSALSSHESDTTSVHGIADTSALALKSEVATDAELAGHEADTTSVHGIANTANLELSTNKVQSLSGNSESEYPSEKAVQAGLNEKVAKSTLEANGMGVVVHGATAGTARPSGFKQITWIGSVEPENAAENDIWIETE